MFSRETSKSQVEHSELPSPNCDLKTCLFIELYKESLITPSLFKCCLHPQLLKINKFNSYYELMKNVDFLL